MLTVVTTCSAEGLVLYGRRFLTSFEQNWTRSVDLVVLADGWDKSDLGFDSTRVVVADLYKESPWLGAFVERHRNNPRANGSRGVRWNAVKFAHKVAAVLACEKMHEFPNMAQHMLWMDADTVTHNRVTGADISTWLPDPWWLSWLDRSPNVINYPECGFLLFNRFAPFHRMALEYIQELYEKDTIFELSETHDSFIWQHTVQHFGIGTRSLSGKGFYTMHPFIHSELGAWFDHLKGESRKKEGRTPKRELLFPRSEEYWR